MVRVGRASLARLEALEARTKHRGSEPDDGPTLVELFEAAGMDLEDAARHWVALTDSASTETARADAARWLHEALSRGADALAGLHERKRIPFADHPERPGPAGSATVATGSSAC